MKIEINSRAYEYTSIAEQCTSKQEELHDAQTHWTGVCGGLVLILAIIAAFVL